MSLKAALCDCRTWMCQCVLVLVLVDRPAALWCSDLSLVASFRFTLWSSLFWFCCHVCWWLITVTTPHRRTCSEAARPGSLCCQVALSLYLSLMTASPAAWTAWRWAGISVMLSLLLWPENSRVMFCMRDKSHLCPQQWARILPAYSQHRHPSSNHLSFGWVSVAAAGVVRRGPAVWRWINIRR